jgi:hypothetical protein
VKPAALALQRFADKWGHPDHLPDRVDSGDLAIAEHEIGRQLPEAYVRAVIEVGLPSPTLSLAHSLIDAEADASDVAAFFTPAQLVQRLAHYRSDETPEDFVAFADTSMGDRFGFRCPRTGVGRAADSAVLLMDHETGKVQEVATSFVTWLLDYNAMAFVRFDG